MTGELIRRTIALVILVVAAGGVYYYYLQTRPCAVPIVYHIGTMDPKFNLSHAAFTADMQKAVALWNLAAGKTLFTYSSTDGLPVNLIFDTRQENANTGVALSNAEKAYNAKKAEVIENRNAFNVALDTYNQEVTYRNSRGGATGSAYTKLEAERKSLDAEQAALNASISDLNAEARALNIQVTNFNTTSGGTFEQGLYHRDASGAEIEVYEFTNQTQLIRLLAHEFGHALGLDHIDDPAAIMYPVNKATTIKLSASDTATLKKLCNLK